MAHEKRVKRPAFEDLPLRPGDPKGSAWGLWGEDDELGALNLLTPEVVKNASKEIVHGVVVPLNLPLDVPLRPMNPTRKVPVHRIVHKTRPQQASIANDDEIDINTQSSSQFDGLRHYPYQETMQFYGGVRQEDITGPGANSKLGIHNMAQHGIVGRGVLLDWRAYALRKGIKHSPFERHAIPLNELLEVAQEENVNFQPGDILVVRTGWTEEYYKLSDDDKIGLPVREMRASIGVEASEEAFKWHWDNQFAAVASDTVAYEAWPSPRPWGVAMHEVFLSGWGMPIGETFDLERLSEECAKLKKWTFFFTSQPLNITNGVASPPNAAAIL
ncbi:hypothetical protein NA57DRAFT_68897 [Rhizodiscina lignyota]|uniref:Cyclase n=1 Tax=Rhizodiscina lignyota TaxID=1504668 RepID=A0A9P4M5H8_9PEZI|nr:hypothetical protein NA57DRAFT_68897 [Rhizodiscina lignyota]